ncbi:unnamed protein product [Tuber melanosporum]|uniref:(Perigord truffle) hypothetical protein n=1 Tax=Tuber melanosporum (strain Mel28) TaxID=656061 RepID=D5G4Z9_TUBMM|nr:uncharacterized protein GSTUM_00000215001 [Tuber melanosporum]CAZ79592.1 unnamed protein product [Tuber melanosporum]
MPTAATSVAETTTPEPAKKRACPPKNCPCEWCGVVFSKSGLGRHYDYWVYSASPGKPDEKHTLEAIQRMREIRKDARRLKGCDKLDPKEIKSRQNKRNYERHKGRHVEKKRAKRMSEMARSMVLKEIAMEISAISAPPTYPTLEPDSEALVNFPALVYAFLSPPSDVFAPSPNRNLSSWGDQLPGATEYVALGVKFKQPDLSKWSQRLDQEWQNWGSLSELEKSKLCFQEIGRALSRSQADAATYKPYARILGKLGGEELGNRIIKWEGRATQLRAQKGRAEELQLEKEWMATRDDQHLSHDNAPTEGGASGSGEGNWDNGRRGGSDSGTSSSGDDTD